MAAAEVDVVDPPQIVEDEPVWVGGAQDLHLLEGLDVDVVTATGEHRAAAINELGERRHFQHGREHDHRDNAWI